jgi:hypothetical protein
MTPDVLPENLYIPFEGNDTSFLLASTSFSRTTKEMEVSVKQQLQFHVYSPIKETFHSMYYKRHVNLTYNGTNLNRNSHIYTSVH